MNGYSVDRHSYSAFGAAIRAVAVTLRYHMGGSMVSLLELRRPEPDPSRGPGLTRFRE